jgi:L,D-transpeptidase-like protein
MKCKHALGLCIAILTMAPLAWLAVLGTVEPAGATSSRDGRRDEFGQSRRAGAPVLAIVSLSEQRVAIYDADGKILQAPVSTGATGYETPAGIYSVVQKKEMHQSNLYEDGSMPFMQRITWTGIALHAGVLPGYPASHGCVRMPQVFAQRLFDMTDVGLRVLVLRDDISPTGIDHPLLFKPNLVRKEPAPPMPPVDRPSPSDRAPAKRGGTFASASDISPSPGSAAHVQTLKSIAAAKSAEADIATRRAKEARQTATRKGSEAAAAGRVLRAAEANLAKLQALLKGAEGGTEAAISPERLKQAEQTKEKALAKIAEAQAQLEAAKMQAKAKTDAAARASEEAEAADAAREAAVEAAAEAARKTSPVSVFISRKTQRLYVRQGYQPVFEGPVTIRDADKPIGTYVFTAMNYANNGVRWSVVSMYKRDADAEPAAPSQRRRAEARNTEAAPADVAGASAALDRITIPPDALDIVSDIVLPGSSLIVSDEGAHIETGKDTDFVVLMSGEPQGGIKTRRREPLVGFGNDDFFGRSRSRGFPFWWN